MDYIKIVQSKMPCNNSSDTFDSVFGFNYLLLYECHSSYLTLLLALMLLPLAFYLLGSTADAFFAPTLGNVCERLKLSPELAGVTLLALGNGAPDVFASIASFTGELASPDLGISALLGAAMFLLTVVLGSVCHNSPNLSVNRVTFTRDIFFFIVTLVIMLAWSAANKATTALHALGFLSIYFIYVAAVFSYDNLLKNRGNESAVGNDEGGVISAFWHNLENEDVSNPTQEYEFAATASYVSFEEEKTNSELGIQSQDGPPAVIENYIRAPIDPRETVLRSTPMFLSESYWSMLRIHKRTLNKRDLTIRILELPFNSLRTLTIPNIDAISWSKSVTVVQPFFIAIFFLFITGNFSLPLGWFFLLAIIVIIAVIFLQLHLHTSEPPKDKITAMILLGLAFTSCIGWIYCVANELVVLLNFLGYVLNANPSILGLTVLAMGNSCGDLFANTAISRNGMGAMAIAGCFGSPLLNILLGLGFGFAIAAIEQPVHVQLDTSCIVSAYSLLVTLVVILFCVIKNHFQVPLFLPKLLGAIYGIYLVISVLVVI